MSIGNEAFSDCSSLVSVTIPNSVTSIGNSAFDACGNLTGINVESVNSYYSSENGILYNKSRSIILRYPEGKSGSFTIPNTVTSIATSAFSGCSGLTSVTISNSVTTIGYHAFLDCSGLTSVTIPNSVAFITNSAFFGCISLHDVFFNSATPPEIGTNVFKYVRTGARAIVPSGSTAYGADGSIWNGLIVTYGQPTTLNASPTASTILVNGKATAFEAYNISGSNYFKLRDLAAALNGTTKQFEVGYDNSTKAIALTNSKPYVPVGGEMAKGDGKAKTAMPTVSRIYLDGNELNLTVYTINSNNFFKLRDLMQAINVYVGYDNQTKVITLDTSSGYIDE
jgi:hypothetical protein